MTPKQAQEAAIVREALRRRAHEINEEVRAILLPAYEALAAAVKRMGADADRFPLVVAGDGYGQITVTPDEMVSVLDCSCIPFSADFRDQVIEQWLDEQMDNHIPDGEDKGE